MLEITTVAGLIEMLKQLPQNAELVNLQDGTIYMRLGNAKMELPVLMP